MSASAAPPTVEILLFDGVDELDAVGPFEVLAAAGLPVRTVVLPAATTSAAGGSDPSATPPTVDAGHPATTPSVAASAPSAATPATTPAATPAATPPTTAQHPAATATTPTRRATVRGANGLTLGVDGTLGVPDGAFGARPGVLVVPGGGWLDGGPGVRGLTEDPEATARIAALHADGTILASVCTGALLLAAAGVLRGRPAVTNRLALDDLRATGADVRDDARVVDDGDVLTAGGPLAGVDLAIRLVERLLGDEAAVAATARIEHERVGSLVVAGGVVA